MLNHSSIATLLLVAGLWLVSCERTNFDELSPASFPTTAEVFIDGFSAGLGYVAFGTSDVTAFEVDEEIAYRGEASMRFAVPDAGSARGSFAGGVFLTEVGRDLTGYDALTFWARASQATTIDLIGFGNDLGESNFLTQKFNTPVNTNWQKYILPIADPSKLTQERGMLIYAATPDNDKGYTFWLDEVKFEKLGTIAHKKGVIFGGQDISTTSETGETFSLDGGLLIFNTPTGIDDTVSIAASYFDFISSDNSVATVDNMGMVTVLDAGTTTISANLAGEESTGSLTVNSTGEVVKPTTSAPTPTFDPDSVISMFSDAYDNVLIDRWNTYWEFSTAIEEFLEVTPGDTMIRYKNLNFVGIEFTSNQIDASQMTHFHMDMWTPDPTDLPNAFKVLLVDFGADGNFSGGDDSDHELSFTSPDITTGEWVSLDIPLTSFTGLRNRMNMAQMVLSGDLANVFIDNVYFYKNGPVGGGGGGGGDAPTVAAPAPTAAAGDVISVFSDAYTDVAGTDFFPDWGQATVVSEVAVEGNATLKYTGLNYQGTQFATSLDLSSMTHMHVDFWSANSNLLNVFLISDGPVETGVSLPVPTTGWGSIDIPLTSFSPVDLAAVIQAKFDGNGDIFLDNIYFVNDPSLGGGGGGGGDKPTTAAPTPSFPAGDVVSIFSDAYTNVDGTDFFPDWGQATVVSQTDVEGNNTLVYTGLNYQGVQLATNQDVSGMGFLHLDFWTDNADSLKVFLISPGPVETPFSLTVPSAGWSSVDIPLSSFSPVDLADVFQFKFEGSGNVYLDNILFRK